MAFNLQVHVMLVIACVSLFFVLSFLWPIFVLSFSFTIMAEQKKLCFDPKFEQTVRLKNKRRGGGARNNIGEEEKGKKGRWRGEGRRKPKKAPK